VQAPILEDKVVDFILELAKVEKRSATPEELMETAGDKEKSEEA
jgi:trigger factor